MVQVTQAIPRSGDGTVAVEAWLSQLQWHYPGKSFQAIANAVAYLQEQGNFSLKGIPISAKQLGIEMAAELSDLNADHIAIVSALLFPLFDYEVLKRDAVESQFGDEVWTLLQGVQKVKALQSLQHQPGEPLAESQVAGLRKVLLSMVNDVRVVLVKLVERLCMIRQLVGVDKTETVIDAANQIMSIYAPLASRLGVAQIKWELEDLAFRCQQPQDYRSISRQLNESRIARETHMNAFLASLKAGLAQIRLQAEVSGRVKHIYSIWRKMQKKEVSVKQLYDLRAVRVLVNEVSDCYQVLGLLNERWPSVAEEFDDYIAAPKPNGYRSIHTVVRDTEGKDIEVQIRTFKMHESNEVGVAAHWRYKEGSADTSLDHKINWLRSLLTWQQELGEHDDDLAVLQSQVIDERVYVFSPDGAVFDFPKGATPLDFAYGIHTDVGHRCRGAQVNRKMVPLTYQLQTGDRVEILTQKISKPSRDWINEHEGYLKTSKARAKVAQWFRQQGRDEDIQAGKELIAKIARQLKITEVDHEDLAKAFHKKTLEELYITLGIGEIKAPSILVHLEQLYGAKVEANHPSDKAIATKSVNHLNVGTQAPLVIGGVDNLMAHMAGCCKPVVGDEVIGYITQGRGVTVHRVGCRQIEVMRGRWPEKFIPVTWSENQGQRHQFAVDLHLIARRRNDLLRDITSMLSNEKIPVLGVRAQQSRQSAIDDIVLTISIDSSDVLQQVITKLANIPDIQQVKRI